MAPINNLSVLAFASAALAIPFNHGHGHEKYHNNRPSGFSAYPLASANSTINASGTGFATGTSAPIAPVSESTVVSDVETTTAVATTYLDSASSSCTSDVTVTSTAKVTVTITPDDASSTEAAPVESSAPAYSEAPSSYSTKAEAAPQETSAAPAAYSSSPAESSSASSPAFTYAAQKKQVDVDVNFGGSSSSSSSSPSSTGNSYGSGNSGKGKRGVAYNDAKLTDCLVDSPSISWGYNWGSSPSGLKDSVKFIPTLWGPKSEFTDDWESNAKKAISNGATHLFSFNEPDLGEQANLTPEEAAKAWKTYMEPFSGKAKLCAPSVTNGGGDKGLGWLSSFLESCSDCTIDCLNIHWYDSADNVDYFKKHINDAVDLGDGKKEVFLSEFAAEGSDDQITGFLEKVMPWMDKKDEVAGYAYFMAGEGKLVSGNEQSAIGKAFTS